jgi:hypothetical protein
MSKPPMRSTSAVTSMAVMSPSMTVNWTTERMSPPDAHTKPARPFTMALTDAAATQLPGIQHSYGGVDGFLAPQAEIVPATFTDHDFLLIETRLVPPARA